LTSCIVEALERIIAERLYHLGEVNGWFSPLQAGFRKGRSCEDQVLKIVQAIEDGFHKSPHERSVLVLLDFSKAYDTVWRQKLLLSMMDLGVPDYLIRWLYGFLRNRQASVRFNGVLGAKSTFHQGLPQGAVLAPVLFIFYIENLAKLLPKSTINALYADDVTIVATHKKKSKANKMAQKAVDIVIKWSKEWKLSLNDSKSESCFFTLDRHLNETQFSPTIIVDGNPIKHNPNPRLLGVILDRELTFTPHCEEISAKMKSQHRMLSSIAHSDWGWRKESLRPIYMAFCRSIFDYAGIAWQPWISDTNILKLEIAQNKCLRIIIGQPKRTHIESLRLEANIPGYESKMKANLMKGREKAMRLPTDHPRRACLDQPPLVRPPPKKPRRNCRNLGIEECDSRLHKEALANRKPIILHSTPPWLADSGQVSTNPNLEGILSKSEDQAKIRDTAYGWIADHMSDYIIYTDGSADGGLKFGGSAAVITTGDPLDPTVVEVLRQKGAIYTCSYGEERDAIDLAMNWLEENHPPTATIITDSKSVCDAIVNMNSDLAPLLLRLKNYKEELHIQWVPGHCGIAGNELADKAAKEAAAMEGSFSPVTYKSVSAMINQITKDPPPQHDRPKRVYAALNQTKERMITCRRDQVLLAKLRSGETPLFREVKATLDHITDPTCPLCLDGAHNLEHWLTQCPGTLERRHHLFGPEHLSKLENLTQFPLEVVALARSTLPGVGH